MGKKETLRTPRDLSSYKIIPTVQTMSESESTQFAGLDNQGNKVNFGESQYDDPKTTDIALLQQGELEHIRGNKQGIADELGNAIGGGLAKIPFTVIGNVASILDFEDYYNTDNEVGNSVTAWAEEMKGNIEGATKIYRSNENTLSSREWWMTNAKGLIDSAGAFAITGAGLGKGIQLLSQLTKGSQIVKGLGVVNNAAMLNQAESIPIAMNVFNDSYNIALEQGKSEEEAIKVAADAATYSININRINIPLNLTSAGAFLRPSYLTRQVAKDVTKKSVLTDLLKEGSQEYLEENINMIAEKEAIRKAKDGNNYAYNFDKTVDDVFSKEGFETGLVGFIGGFAQTGLTKAYNSLYKDSESFDEDGNTKYNPDGSPVLVSKTQSERERFTAQKKSLNTIEGYGKIENVPTVKEIFNKLKETSIILNDIQEASLTGDDSKVEQLQNKLLANQALDAFKNGTTEQLIEQYKSLAKDPQSKEKFGEEVHIRTNEAVKQIEDLEKIYLNNQGTKYTNQLFDNRANHYNNLKVADKLEAEILKAQIEQQKEIKVTGYTTPEEVNTLQSTKTLQNLISKMKDIGDNVIALNDEYNAIREGKLEPKQKEDAIPETNVDETFKENTAKPVETEFTFEGKQARFAYIDKKTGEKMYRVFTGQNRSTTIKESKLDQFKVQSTDTQPVTPVTQTTNKASDSEIDRLANVLSTASRATQTEQVIESNTQELPQTKPLKDRFLSKHEFNRFDGDVSPEGLELINNLDFTSPEVQSNLTIKVTEKPFEAEDGSLIQSHEIGLYHKDVFLGYLMNPNGRSKVKNTNEEDNAYIEEQKALNAKLFNYLVSSKKDSFNVKNLVDKGLFTINTSGGSFNTFKGDVKDRPVISNYLDLVAKDSKGRPYIYDTKESSEGFVQLEDSLEEALPGTGKPSDKVTDRYVVAVKRPNDTIQWVAAQPQTASDELLNNIITKIKDQSSKAFKVNGEEIKDTNLNEEFNKSVDDDIYISIPFKEAVKLPYNHVIRIGVAVKGGLRIEINPQIKGQKSTYININDNITQQINTIEDLIEAINANKSGLIKNIEFNRSSFRSSVSKMSAKDAATQLQMNLDVTNPFSNNNVILNFSESKIPVTEEIKSTTKEDIDNTKKVAERLSDDLNITSKIIKDVYLNGLHYVETENGKYYVVPDSMAAGYGSEVAKEVTKEQILKPFTKVTTSKVKPEPKLTTPKVEVKPDPNKDLTRLEKIKARLLEDISFAEINDLENEKIALESKLKNKGIAFKQSDIAADELIDIKEATDWIKERLPDSINVADIDQIADNIVNKGATWGAFKDGLIYLSKLAGKGTEYHEAFHGVFRTLLSDSDIQRYLNLAKIEHGKPTAKQIANTKDKYGLDGYNDSQISDIILEEYMADKFMDYVKAKQTKSLPGLKSLFQKIKNWIDNVLLHNDTMDALFYNIERGSFKSKQIVKNNYLSNYVYMLLPTSPESRLNSADSEKIVATIAMEWAKIKSKDNTLKDKDIINDILDDKIELVSLSYQYNQDLMSTMSPDTKIKFKKQLMKEQYIYSNMDSRELIIDEVKKRGKIFNFTSDENIEEAEDLANEQGDRFDRNASNIGGFGSLSKAIRELIAFTTVKYTDEFGREVTRSVDVPTVYNGIERLLANTPKSKMMKKLKNYSKYNEEVKAFYNKLKGLVQYDEVNDVAKPNSTYNSFTTAFFKAKVKYLFMRYDTSNKDYIISNANQKDVGIQQVSRWSVNYDRNSNKQEALNTVKAYAKYLKPSDEIKDRMNAPKLNTAIKDLTKALNDLGITVSEGYVEYSILFNRDLTPEQADHVATFDEVFPIQGFDQTNFTSLMGLFEQGDPFVKAAEGEKDNDGITRLKNIAEGNAIFDENVGSSSFQNADGETVYDKILASYTIRRVAEYVNNKNALNTKSLDAFRVGHKHMSEYDLKNLFELLKKNPLVQSQFKDAIFDKDFTIKLIDGLRQTNLNVNKDTQESFEDLNKSKKEGKTFKGMQLRDTLLTMYSLFDNTVEKHIIDDSGAKKTLKFADFYFKVMEASSTAYVASLPVEKYWNYGMNKASEEALYSFFEQEFDRINRGYKELSKIEKGKANFPIIKDYHNGELRAINFWNFDYLSENLQEDLKKLAQEGKPITEDFKKQINIQIKDNITKEYQAHLDKLVELNVIKPSKKDDKVIKGSYDNVLLPSDYANNGKVNLDKVGNFVMNDLINSWAFNQLTDGDWAYSRKDKLDFVKRNKGSIAMQETYGEGLSKGAIIKEPKVDGIKNADAQMWESLTWRIHKLTSLGKFNNEIKKIYDKIVADEDITDKELDTLSKSDATLISDKDVYFDGIHYFKLSSFPLTRQYTSMKVFEGTEGAIKSDINGKFYVALPGREWEFSLQNEMEANGIDYVMPESASKGATKDVSEVGNLKANTYQNSYWGKQVNTPSGKTMITEPTQKDGLIDSEQNPALKEVIERRQTLVAQRLEVLYNQAKSLLKDQFSDNQEYTLEVILDKFRETLENSGADVNLVEFFSRDANGKQKYNLNMPLTISKFEQLFYAHFTRDVLKVKAPGYAMILKSEANLKVARKAGKVVTANELRKGASYDELTELQHAVADSDGNVYSEVMIPAHFAEMFGLTVGQELTGDILKMMGVRIPTQDKHSMLTLKVVDFLPKEYGSIIIAPKEVVLLSGADFDVDKMYIRRFEHYIGADGKIKIYGKNGNDLDTRWNEFLEYQKDRNDNIKFEVNNGLPLLKALKKYGFPTTKEEFSKLDKEINLGILHNQILEAEIKLYSNEYIRDIANTPATLDELKDLVDEIGIKSKASEFNVNSINGKLAAKGDIDTGKANIGPSAIGNMLFNLFAKNNVKLFETSGIEFNGEKLTEFNYTNSEGKRVNHIISTLVSAMTDNAKEALAGVFNLTPETLQAAMYMVSLGMPLKTVLKFTTSPILQEYTARIGFINAGLKSGAEDNINDRQIILELLVEYSEKSEKNEDFDPLFVNDDTLDLAKDSNIQANIAVFNKFLEFSDQSKQFYKVNKLMQLNKGFKPSVSENNTIDKAAKELFDIDGNTPFDINTLFNENTQVGKQYIIYNEVHNEISKEFFLNRTKVFDTIKNYVLANIKAGSRNAEAIAQDIDRNLLSYLSINAYKKYLIDNNLNEENATKALNTLNTSIIFGDLIDRVSKLKATNKTSKLLSKINIEKSSDSKTLSFDILAVDNRLKSHPAEMEQILNDFHELYLNEETKQTAIDLFNYMVIKDGMQFKNRSISRLIAPFMYRMISKSIDSTIEAVKNDTLPSEEFVKVFGKNKEDFVNDFLKLNFEWEPNVFDYVPFHDKKISKQVMTEDENGLIVDLFKGYEKAIPPTTFTNDYVISEEDEANEKSKSILAKNRESINKSKAFNYTYKDNKYSLELPIYVKIGDSLYKLTEVGNKYNTKPVDSFTDVLNSEGKVAKFEGNITQGKYVKVAKFGDKNFNPFGSNIEENRVINDKITEFKQRIKTERASKRESKLFESQMKAAEAMMEFESRTADMPIFEEKGKNIILSKMEQDIDDIVGGTSDISDSDMDNMIALATANYNKIDFLTLSTPEDLIDKKDENKLQDKDKSSKLDDTKSKYGLDEDPLTLC